MKEVTVEPPQLFTSHWRSPLLADVDAVIVGVSRGTPRWPLPFKYRRLLNLAPGNQAWNAEDQEAFERSYLKQLEVLGTEAILADLERVAAVKPAILVCWEKPGEWCHRRRIADYLHARTGIVIPELKHGMLEKRSTAQPTLFDQKGGV